MIKIDGAMLELKLMIMAGTTEGTEIIARMAVLDDVNIVATTTTTQGAELARSAGAHEVLSQSLDKAGIEELIMIKEIDVLVDATHPFAQEATKNAIKAADARGIEYMRFERLSLKIPENDLVYAVNSFEEAVEKILKPVEGVDDTILKFVKGADDKILHLAGVMTLHYLTENIKPHRIVARVLPSLYSLEKCLELRLPAENIIAMQGIFSKEFNKALMEEYDISLVVTKESGEAGGTPSKIEAALELGIPVVIVMRPEVRELTGKKVFKDVRDVIKELVNLK